MREKHFNFDGEMIAMGPLIKTRFQMQVEEAHPALPGRFLPSSSDESFGTHRTENQTTQAPNAETHVRQNTDQHT